MAAMYATQATPAAPKASSGAGADALVVVTEWREFRSPDFQRLRDTMRQPVVFDGRNLYEPALMRQLGFAHCGIGRSSRGASTARSMSTGSVDSSWDN